MEKWETEELPEKRKRLSEHVDSKVSCCTSSNKIGIVAKSWQMVRKCEKLDEGEPRLSVEIAEDKNGRRVGI